MRPRTRAELAKALARKEISDEVIAEVLDRYDEVGIIDDAAFARAWVSSRHQGRGLARRALANELRQRGVAAEVAGEALEIARRRGGGRDRACAGRPQAAHRLGGSREAVFRRLGRDAGPQGLSGGGGDPGGQGRPGGP